MSKKSFSILAFLWVMLVSVAVAQQPITDPVVYNEKIVDAQNEIGREILEFIDFMGAGAWEDAEKHLQDVISVTNSQIQVVKAMPEFEGNSSLRNAAVELFQFYNATFKSDYREILDILKKETLLAKDEQRIQEIINNLSAAEASYDEKFRTEQNAFAQTHNMQLIENELQGELDGE
jgi:hypothetical protein